MYEIILNIRCINNIAHFTVTKILRKLSSVFMNVITSRFIEGIL